MLNVSVGSQTEYIDVMDWLTNSIIALYIILSRTLDMVHNNDIGLQFLTEDLSPDL